MSDLIRRSDVLALLAGDDVTGYKPSALREMVEQIPNALPCEIGAPLYCVISDDWPEVPRHYIEVARVEELLITEDGVLVGTGDGCFDKLGSHPLWGGIYLTYAEAEAELEKLQAAREGQECG